MTAQTPAGKCTTRTSTSPARAQQGPLVWKSKLLSDSVWLEDFPTSLPRTNIKQVSATTTRCPWVNTSGGAETRLSSSSRFSHELDINIPDCLLRKLRHGEVLGLFQGLTTRKDGSSEPRSSMSDRKDHVTPPPCREHKKSQPLFDFNKNMFLLKKTWSILSAAVFI
ncbi:uncharacterized protein LOC118918336 isoform X4 [Manis pentadactyla]|uniref:uncharacterized protein LOC118918336 isoform X4 n=1 Tax=Manis pentadactyla TaxID=143292 RepID=UPI00255C4ED0|nr:uncharacterized protein LOC118918336 isoform X4 [Manis pentadactyla]